MRLLPEGVPQAARILYIGRGLRAFGDGFVSLLLPVYITALGFDAFAVGLISTATLLGSAALTIGVGLSAHRFGRRALLVVASLVMIGTGIGFLLLHELWPLVLIAFLGTLNPSPGDVSVFYPLEQALLAETVPAQSRTAAFAVYALIGSLVAALGALAAALPELLQTHFSVAEVTALQAMFALYTLLGLATFLLYRRLPAVIDRRANAASAPLGPSKGLVFALAGLFSLDAFGGGLVVQSLLALWLFQRFGLSLVAAGSIFFWAGLFTALSYLAAVRLSRRIGLVNTMVFTHLPANFCMIALPFAPNLAVAIALLLIRAALSQMDVPTRSSYVMAVVTPPERAAAASVTALPRSLASAVAPMLAGWLFALSPFGWPLVAAGGLKAIYDLLLLLLFRRHKPPEEQD
ncbi:MAG TPA: MFS transporter [Stellaceae bacterium]|nr:MFS transporter [Stellaceae bacterium]